MPTPFLDLTIPVYQCLNTELSNSFAFSPTRLVFLLARKINLPPSHNVNDFHICSNKGAFISCSKTDPTLLN